MKGNTMSKKEQDSSCRLNRVGGQAVLEGVMMKAGERTVTTCRKEDGTLVVSDNSFVSVKKKHKFLGLPIIRGVVGFIESMILSVKTLNVSADALGLEEEESKSESWMKKHLGVGVTDVIMTIGVILGVLLAVGLFFFLPTYAAKGIEWLVIKISGVLDFSFHPIAISFIEGGCKVIIFIVYLLLVSLMKDIRRTFMYHGAEHKSIACFEAGEELTPENAKKYKRFHPRCGTSFMFLMILLGILAGAIVRVLMPEGLPQIAYVGVRLLTLPLVMGVGYEILMLAGKHDNIFTRIISAPGLWMQRITTKEPTEDMLECAIISIKCALRDDYPEFREFYEARSWESTPTAAEDGATSSENTEGNAISTDNGDASDGPDIAESATENNNCSTAPECGAVAGACGTECADNTESTAPECADNAEEVAEGKAACDSVSTERTGSESTSPCAENSEGENDA